MMDTMSTDRERREMNRRRTYEDDRRARIDDRLNRVCAALDTVLSDAIDEGLTWREAIDCMWAWCDAEEKSKHAPPKQKEKAK